MPNILEDLYLFKHDKTTINFTVMSDKKEARPLMRDGLLSAVNSVFYRTYPTDLIMDSRGTIYFYLTILDGNLFESYYNPALDEDVVNSINYGQWEVKMDLDSKADKILHYSGEYKDFNEVQRAFGDRFIVEVITYDFINEYISNVESTFNSLDNNVIGKFGNGWTKENFPYLAMDKPLLKFLK